MWIKWKISHTNFIIIIIIINLLNDIEALDYFWFSP